MEKFYRYIVGLVVVVSMFSSCKRQHICKEDSQTNSARVWVMIDWSESNMDQDQINNVSIYAYADQGDEPYIKVSGNIDSAYIDLPVGVYTLLVVSDFVGDVEGVVFGDQQQVDQFYAQIIQSDGDELWYDLQQGELLAESMGQIAAWSTTSLEVSTEMLLCSCCEQVEDTVVLVEVEAQPTVRTTRCSVDLSVVNLDNAASIEVLIRGFAAGVMLADNSRYAIAEGQVLYSMNLEQRVYSSQTDGVVSGSINTFGKVDNLESQSYEVVINIILNNGEILGYLRDVTDQLLEQDNIDIVISLSDEDDLITLPESTASGFGVESWGDNEQVHLM